MKYDTKSILNTSKKFYSNLAANLLAKFPKWPNRCTIKFVSDYYKKLSLSENFKLESTTESYLFDILVKPLFKKSSKTDPSNYTPISLLPFFSKVFERVVLDQTEEF